MKGRDVMLAVDLGAGSGRVIAAAYDGKELEARTISRFPTRRIDMLGRVYWDFPAIYREVVEAMRKCVAGGMNPVSIGVDSWGVDYGLIDSGGELLSLPRSYRDPAFNGLANRFFATRDIDAYYASAGIYPMDINSLFQLWKRRIDGDPKLDAAESVLFIPDLLTYFLCGEKVCEYTISSTSGMLDARSRSWDESILREAGIPRRLLHDVAQPASVAGRILPQIAEATGASPDMPVISVCGHDTQSAVAALPEYTGDAPRAFLSSGTWSLLGVEAKEPVLTREARLSGFSNEGGPFGRINLLQNITGMWILQQLREQWLRRGEDISWGEMQRLASDSGYADAIDPDDNAFASPGDMEGAIAAHCRRNGLRIPSAPGEFAMAAMRGLALRYARGIRDLGRMLPQPVARLDIIGGGNRNALLNELTHEATGIPIVTGEAEASSAGNLRMQALALGISVPAGCRLQLNDNPLN